MISLTDYRHPSYVLASYHHWFHYLGILFLFLDKLFAPATRLYAVGWPHKSHVTKLANLVIVSLDTADLPTRLPSSSVLRPRVVYDLRRIL
ncbi:unnamed protein product [Arabis nemorensis]|uniref:Uncharacterized protein n=1 Tax=Arabis nemorensis TaxID=586526 RepID=A0A565AQJ9_9BRAS|nr:unnamed protein product [Arabis nemorensis]